MQRTCLVGKEKDRNCVKHSLLCLHPHQALKIAVVTVTEIIITARIVKIVVIVIIETPMKKIDTLIIAIMKTAMIVKVDRRERTIDITMIDTKATTAAAEMTMAKAGIAMIPLHLLRQEVAEINLVIMMMTIAINNSHHHSVHYLLSKNNDPTAQVDQDTMKRIAVAITIPHLSKAKGVQEAMVIDPIAMIKAHQ